MRIPSIMSNKKTNQSLQRSELYHFSAVDVFFELLKRRICYYTKKAQASEQVECEFVSNGRSSCRVIRSKLRKREETSDTARSGVVPPEGVLQAPVEHRTQVTVSAVQAAPVLESIFISSVPNGAGLPFSPSDSSLSSCTSTESTLHSSYSTPSFLYSTGHSRTSLNCSEQSIGVHASLPPECEEKKKKHVFRGLRRKKTPPSPTYAIPIEYQDQLKKIYVY